MERRADFRVVEGSSSPPLSTSPIGRAQFLNDINHRALLLVWQIVDAVHKNGSFIFLQLMALGRTAHPDVLREEGGYQLVAPSPIPMSTPKVIRLPRRHPHVRCLWKRSGNTCNCTPRRLATLSSGQDSTESRSMQQMDISPTSFCRRIPIRARIRTAGR